jgi:hypothetical protein
VKKTSVAPTRDEAASGVQGRPRPVLPLSIPEWRRLLWRLVLSVPQTARHRLRWSQGRRWHQATAHYDHYRRRQALREAVAA